MRASGLFVRLGLVAALLTGCGYLIPASWRAFRVDPDDAVPAITRALAAEELEIDDWDQAEHRITSKYETFSNGIERLRERYIVRWERNDNDDTLVIFVRHEMQDQEVERGRMTWSSTRHDGDKQAYLLEAITRELERQHRPLSKY